MSHRKKIILFFIISILIHLLLFVSLKKDLFFPNIKIEDKNKDKNISKVKFIDLPDEQVEKKHDDPSKYVAQKSFKAEKDVKKDNPLTKNKEIPETKPKIAEVKEILPKIPTNADLPKPKRERKDKIKEIPKPHKEVIQKEVEHKIAEKESEDKQKKMTESLKAKSNIAFNKITPDYKELLEKGLLPPKSKDDINKSKIYKNNQEKQGDKTFQPTSKGATMESSEAHRLSPNVFRPSQIYPDDIDISDSISISTQSNKFASYLHKVKRKIELVWEYPRVAGEMGIGGRLFVKFTINKTGKLEKVELLKSSGAQILDREAIRAINDAADYPSFPKDNSFGVERIKIHACFDYIISGREVW